ncbi:hypothetical protein [Breznakia pachnodae]|uniref:Uncharacterized protein n=1 Tax=Breznakia pachnodae TaxID=265178 RepID=A0ABU0E770_9FIRM|nr:hypothetical protein [Breznakia pachnodae]MDQ0362554.1 hypothetical protein [Breznakia pachnodae]
MTTRMTIFFVIIISFVVVISIIYSQLQKKAYKRTYNRICNTIDNEQILNVWIERKISIRRNNFKPTTIKSHDSIVIETVDPMNNEVSKKKFLMSHLHIKRKTNMNKLIYRDFNKQVIYLSYEHMKVREEIQSR